LLFIAAVNVPCKRPLGSGRGAELPCFRDSTRAIGRDHFTHLGSAKDAEVTLRGRATLHRKGRRQDSGISKPSTTYRVTEQERHSHAATTTTTTTKCLHRDLCWLNVAYIFACLGES